MHLQFQSLPSELWKVAGGSPESNQRNAIITPQSDKEGADGRWRESEYWNKWGGKWRVRWEWSEELDGNDREGMRIKMAMDGDSRWGWMRWDRSNERLRDVSVTAHCADIDPSLVHCLQETESERNTRTDTPKRLWGDHWANTAGEKDRKTSDCLSPLFTSELWTVCTCTNTHWLDMQTDAYNMS